MLASPLRLKQKGNGLQDAGTVRPMTEFERQRRSMVDCQIRVADVTDRGILEAFLETPREDFAPADRRDVAYLDTRLPLGVPGRAGYEPMTLARLLQLAAPKPSERALVVGCGLGYTAALLSQLVTRVVALECDPALAGDARGRLAGYPSVTVVEGELPDGAAAEGPFDLIFCDGAVAANLDALAAQLSPAGRLVAPFGSSNATKATLFRAHRGSLCATPAFDAYGPKLPGFEPAETFAF